MIIKDKSFADRINNCSKELDYQIKQARDWVKYMKGFNHESNEIARAEQDIDEAVRDSEMLRSIAQKYM